MDGTTLQTTSSSDHVDAVDPDAEIRNMFRAAGVALEPEIFNLILELVKSNYSPISIVQMLKLLSSSKQP
eukprot:m.867268 g.867268  ORF g.867268 m.867268 type:complete len:70 (-) comp23554_c5_seq6:799-1008(-)